MNVLLFMHKPTLIIASNNVCDWSICLSGDSGSSDKVIICVRQGYYICKSFNTCFVLLCCQVLFKCQIKRFGNEPFRHSLYAVTVKRTPSAVMKSRRASALPPVSWFSCSRTSSVQEPFPPPITETKAQACLKDGEQREHEIRNREYDKFTTCVYKIHIAYLHIN